MDFLKNKTFPDEIKRKIHNLKVGSNNVPYVYALRPGYSNYNFGLG